MPTRIRSFISLTGLVTHHSAKRWVILPRSSFILEAEPSGHPSTFHVHPSGVAALLKSLAAPDVKERFAEQSVETIGSKPEEFDRVIRDDIAKWSKVVKISGAKPD